jgi:hypothetical protein
MSWIIYGLFLFLVGFIIYKHRFFHLAGLPRKSTLVFFSLKIVAGLAMWYVYTWYYPQREYADIWKYYDDSEVVYNALGNHPGDYVRLMSGIGIDDRIQHEYIDKMLHWDQQFENNLFNDSHTIIRFNALVRLISYGNYHIHSLFMSLLAFIGLCALYHWIYKFLWQWKKLVAFILFVSPSLLFWSSGVLKEGILFFALGMLILHAWRFAEDSKKYRLIWIAISLLLLAMTKLYTLVFILPALGLAIHLMKKPRFALVKTIGLFIVMITTGILIAAVRPDYSPFRIIAAKQHDFLNLARGGTYIMDNYEVVYLRPDQRDKLIAIDTNGSYMISRNTEVMYWIIADNFKDTLYRNSEVNKSVYTILSDSPVAGSLMNVDPLQPTAASILYESPGAIFRSAARPYPWEIKPVMILPSTLENLLLWLTIVACAVWYRKPSSKAAFWFCVVYVIITLAVTGLTTPVLGALVRYRITAIPFLLFAILLCTDRQRLVKRFPVLDRIL